MTPRLRVSGVHKRYGSTAALRGVDLELAAGEVHAVVGENGAGKSTLMKILSGAERPDAGTLELGGRPFAPRHPVDARLSGVVMVYQELAVCPDLSVEANIMLGQERAGYGLLDAPNNRMKAAQALRDLGHPEVDLHAPLSSLGPPARQVVEIARALVSAATVLVLDEPTSALPREDVLRLFDLIRRLKAAGMTIVYISHFLEEVEEIADRFTVLRDGVAVGGGKVGEVAREKMIEMMVGRAVEEQYPHTPHAIGEPLLELTELTGDPLPIGVNLSLRRGEILGIAGIVGSGRTELLRAIYGLDQVRRGRVRIGMTLDTGATPAKRIAGGVGFLSEDRKQEGLALEMSVADNVSLSRLGRGFVSRARLARAVSGVLAQLGVRYRDTRQAAGELSGGNQQKVALARLFYQGADILLLDEPTKGVDVGSKAETYRHIGAAAASGKAVIVVSSYLPELFGVCDTLAVMCRGKLTEMRPVAEWTPETVIAAATRSS
jgi:ribose transport system ATP-binding protein